MADADTIIYKQNNNAYIIKLNIEMYLIRLLEAVFTCLSYHAVEGVIIYVNKYNS